MTTVGFIETKELVGNVEATDAMLKAMDVELVGIDTIDAGLVTVVVTGEVGVMKAATEAGAEAASRMRESLAIHVTPRPYADIVEILLKPGPAVK